MLFIISTPLGNLGDITYRAVKTLSQCDYILAEDTRKSKILCDHYQISSPIFSFHSFNEKNKENTILSDLHNGKDIALISDAGTPIMCDPGYRLVERCIDEKIAFTALPGPSSVINSLVLSGLPPFPFQFMGFIPKKKKSAFLQQMLSYGGTSIAFESPQRIEKTLKDIAQLDPERKIVIAREMTKKFEQCLRATPCELLDHFQKHPPKGEIVILLEEKELSTEKLSPLSVIELLQKNHGLSEKEAILLAAKITKIPKRDIYQQFFQEKGKC